MKACHESGGNYSLHVMQQVSHLAVKSVTLCVLAARATVKRIGMSHHKLVLCSTVQCPFVSQKYS